MHLLVTLLYACISVCVYLLYYCVMCVGSSR